MDKRVSFRLVLALLVGFFGIVAAGPAQADTLVYVDKDAIGANDGTSWADAYVYLQDALAAATPGTTMRVAQGTYFPDEGGGQTPGDRTAGFQLTSGVLLRGGYAGYGEPDPYDRSIGAYETTLSGDIGVGDDSDNSYHVVDGSGCDETAVLDGFTITGGNADAFGTDRYGAGMYIYDGRPTVSNCTFSDNSADGGGGGVYNYQSSPTVTNCTFSGNDGLWGGGMLNTDSNPTLTNCTFSDNSASYGAGIHNDKSSPTVSDCTFRDNSATYGGGIHDGSGSPTVTNCTFSHNTANYGGGMGNGGGSPTVTNCTFSDNSGTFGGGASNSLGNLRLTNCTFSDNTAVRGGGIHNGTGSATVINCILWGNTPKEIDGGGLVTVTCSDVQDGWTGEGNIDANPLFEAGTLRLSAGSPCIDAGDNDAVPASVTTDLGGGPRFVDDPVTPDTGIGTPPIVDMGAYEYGTSPGPGTIPYVVGEALSWAQVMITSAGFVVGTTSARYNDTVPAGYVLSQDPAAGTVAAPGSAVDLVMSLGPQDGSGAVQACCFADGSCQDLTSEECTAQGGTPQGEGATCAATDCSEPAVRGLVAHYKLDETSGTIAHDSAGTNDGILYGNPAWVPGPIHGALSLDGIDDYVDCGNSPLFDLTEQITVAAWVNIESVLRDSTTRTIIGKGDTAWRLSIGPSIGKGGRKFLFAVCRDPCVNVVYSNTGVTAGQWHHVCATYDHRTIRLYVDGVLDAALRNTQPIPTNAHNVYIGENAATSGQFWRGSIDDVRVYDYALSGDEIVQLLCSDPPPGDVNGDCEVDFLDLAIVMSNWLRCELPAQELCGQ